MIERALYFAIGFLTAALAAMAVAPLLSRRAMRLASARARLLSPLSERQALADLDALRAGHAVEQARLERKLARAQEATIALRADAGRHFAEATGMRREIADLESALYDQRAESEKLAADGRHLRATFAAMQIAVDDAFAERDGAVAKRSAAEARVAGLEAEAGRDRARIAVGAARVEYLEGRVEELTEATKAARRETAEVAAALEAERARVAATDGLLGAAAAKNGLLTEELAQAAAERRDLADRIAELEERLRLGERAREEALLEHGLTRAELADREAGLAAATGRAAALEARLAAEAAEFHVRENDAFVRAEKFAAAQSVVEGYLRIERGEQEALKRENASLRDRIAALSEASRAADAQLRESIGRLGRQVVRLFDEERRPDRQDSSAAAGTPPDARDVEAATAPAGEEAGAGGDGPWRRAGRTRASKR